MPSEQFSGSLEASEMPVTVVREIFVRRGAEREFESGMNALIQEAERHSGHQGATVVRPSAPGAPYRFIYKFDSHSHLDQWHQSETRARLFAPLSLLVEKDIPEEYPGLETWFDLPTASTPLKWKTTLVTWAAIYTIVMVVSYGMRAVHFEADIPLRAFVLTAITVPTAAYLVVPRLAKWLHGWLHSGTEQQKVKRISL